MWADITFKPVTHDDLPLLREWIARPHWQAWWGDTDTEIGYIEDMLNGRDTTRPFLFLLGDDPAGYIQTWTIADQLFEPWLSEAPWMKLVAEESIGVDVSLADINQVSKGIGSRVVSAFVQNLRNEGFTEIIIDPDPKNTRAVRAYEKAGFKAMPRLLGKTGDYLIMRHEG